MIRVYCIGPDYLAALDYEDAWLTWCEHHGEKREDYHESDMSLVADDTILSAFVDERGEISDGGETAHRTARQWADHAGRGFLFSSEF